VSEGPLIIVTCRGREGNRTRGENPVNRPISHGKEHSSSIALKIPWDIDDHDAPVAAQQQDHL
jgi:hypothetical protein